MAFKRHSTGTRHPLGFRTHTQTAHTWPPRKHMRTHVGGVHIWTKTSGDAHLPAACRLLVDVPGCGVWGRPRPTADSGSANRWSQLPLQSSPQLWLLSEQTPVQLKHKNTDRKSLALFSHLPISHVKTSCVACLKSETFQCRMYVNIKEQKRSNIHQVKVIDHSLTSRKL